MEQSLLHIKNDLKKYLTDLDRPFIDELIGFGRASMSCAVRAFFLNGALRALCPSQLCFTIHSLYTVLYLSPGLINGT